MIAMQKSLCQTQALINVPAGGIILTGCTLTRIAAPPGVVGGSAVGSSVFNPFRCPGFKTGSYRALQRYTP